MGTTATISELPAKPVVYALMGGSSRNKYVAYVGIGGNLRARITQHLVQRDSSVATGTAAACLNPDYVTEVRWWQHKTFKKVAYREAAEVVAVRVLDPTLRSRAKTTKAAKAVLANRDFAEEMFELFSGEATGLLEIHNLQSVVERLERLEAKLGRLSHALSKP